MKLYDSLSKQYIEITDKVINIYNCGPTVYNHIHIGNARPLIVFDVLFRTFKALGYEVNYLHNLTDIDDKIIKAAASEGVPELELSDRYAKAYEEVRKQLNTLPMMIEKVSDNIQGIIEYIGRMLANGTAYSDDGNVYFNTAKVSDYGILSNRNLDEQIIGERVSADDKKINETDFVLWKKTKEGIQWDTPWCKGRPGWHSECSFLIEKHFGTNLTIHGGGIDLKFPHHENENAQHEALHNCHLAKIWMHVGHINVDNQKMSKSLGNFVLVKDILKKYRYQSIRWFMYQTNYRNPLDFNANIMEECNKQIAKLELTINSTKSLLINIDKLKLDKSIKSDEFLNELSNDLNIANAITIIQEMVKKINVSTRQKDFDAANLSLNQLINSLEVLGIAFEDIHNEDNIKLIKDYYKQVESKNFVESDKLRKTLTEKGLL